MPRTKKEAGAAYIEKLLKLIPEDKRGAIKEALDPLAESAGEEVLLRDDYSRAMDAVTAKENEVKANSEKVVAYHGQLTNWYNGIAQDLAKGNEAVAELAKNKGAAPDPNAAPAAFDQSKFLSKEEATKLLGQSQQHA